MPEHIVVSTAKCRQNYFVQFGVKNYLKSVWWKVQLCVWNL